jgi:hypothetical protein
LSRMSLKRMALGLSLLVAVGLVAAGSAGAVTITSWVGGKASVPQVITAAGTCPGTVVTINGTGFVNDGGITGVSIGGVPAGEITIGSDTVLFARTGANANNGGAISVTTRAGTATSSVPVIVYPCQATAVAAQKPAVDSLSPKTAKAGGKLTLNGIGFVGIKTVLVGVEKANYSVPSDNLMYIRLPDDIKSGAVTIVITNTLGATKTTVNVK